MQKILAVIIITLTCQNIMQAAAAEKKEVSPLKEIIKVAKCGGEFKEFSVEYTDTFYEIKKLVQSVFKFPGGLKRLHYDNPQRNFIPIDDKQTLADFLAGLTPSQRSGTPVFYALPYGHMN